VSCWQQPSGLGCGACRPPFVDAADSLCIVTADTFHNSIFLYLLGDEACWPKKPFLQRLLALDKEEANELIVQQLAEKPLVEVCDTTILPISGGFNRPASRLLEGKEQHSSLPVCETRYELGRRRQLRSYPGISGLTQPSFIACPLRMRLMNWVVCCCELLQNQGSLQKPVLRISQLRGTRRGARRTSYPSPPSRYRRSKIRDDSSSLCEHAFGVADFSRVWDVAPQISGTDLGS